MKAAATPLPEILERDWDRQLFATGRQPGLATLLGWESQWTFLSKGSRAGYPDRTCCRERIIFVELKREESTATPLTDAQRDWLDRLAAAGGECYLWRPSDLDEAAQVLSKRWSYRLIQHRDRKEGRLHLSPVPGTRIITERDWWTPRSLWVAGVGRADTIEQQTLLTTKGAAA